MDFFKSASFLVETLMSWFLLSLAESLKSELGHIEELTDLSRTISIPTQTWKRIIFSNNHSYSVTQFFLENFMKKIFPLVRRKNKSSTFSQNI